MDGQGRMDEFMDEKMHKKILGNPVGQVEIPSTQVSLQIICFWSMVEHISREWSIIFYETILWKK